MMMCELVAANETGGGEKNVSTNNSNNTIIIILWSNHTAVVHEVVFLLGEPDKLPSNIPTRSTATGSTSSSSACIHTAR